MENHLGTDLYTSFFKILFPTEKAEMQLQNAEISK